MSETASAATGTPKAPAPLPAEGAGSLGWWRTQITASDDKINTVKHKWKRNLDRYLVQTDGAVTSDTIFVPMDFANVEQKKAELYFRNPEVLLTAAPGHTAQADAVQAFGVLLNETLGPDGVDAETAMDELLMDVLCPSGIGVVVIGMELAIDGTQQVQTGTKPGAPMPGSILGLQAPEVPVFEDVPNIIHQSYFLERKSPLELIIPAQWHGSNFDKAPFLGYKDRRDRTTTMRDLGLSEQEASTASTKVDRLNASEQPKGRDTDEVTVTTIFYKGSLYNPSVKHPEEIWRLILVDGVERVIKHDRPYQEYAADQKTLIGVMGNPVCVYTARYVSDSALPPSDCQMSSHQVDEISKGRSQMIQQRDRSKPMRWLDITGVDPSIKEKVERGEWQEIILTTRNGSEMMGEIARATFGRESFLFNDVGERDVRRTWGFEDTTEDTSRKTATELSIQDKRKSTRMDKERNRLAKWYSKTAAKIGGLIQLFEDQRTTVLILGDDGEQRLAQWDLKALPLRFVCTAKPDTMVQPDTARDFKKSIDTYQMTANDPNVNRVELLTQLFRNGGYDPSKLINKAPPAVKPDVPKISASITGDDLNPSMPQFPTVLNILTAGGITIDPENISLGLALAQKQLQMGVDPSQAGSGPVHGQPPQQTAHGGAAAQVHPLSQHPLDQTGQLPGGGADKAGAVM